MNEVILKEIYSRKNDFRVDILSRFFKTGKGQYGEGDIFLGLTVPMCRKIAIKYKNISIKEIENLLKNKIHEVRLIALFILISQYKKATLDEKENIVKFYLKNTKYVNNWDLVDLSAYHILGDFLLNKKPARNATHSVVGGDRKILLKLSSSKNLWEQRIAMVSTFAFIRKGETKWTIKIAKTFLNHKHDLIHKATGWMLREMGKRNVVELCRFIDENIYKMPRTMLRYSIEKFPEHIRKEYLRK